MMKVLFLVAACALAASAEELTWNAQSIAIGGSELWSSDGDALAPGQDDAANDIAEIQFGNEDSEATLNVPVADDLHSGLKITFNSATKLVLGDGKGSTKLIFDGNKRGATLTYIPGSGVSKDMTMSEDAKSTYDVMCHTNWVTADNKYKAPDADGNILGPCDGDVLNFDATKKVVTFTEGKQSVAKRADGIVFAQLVGGGTRYFEEINAGGSKLECTDDNELGVGADTADSYQLDLGSCGKRTSSFRLGEKATKPATMCATSCPPLLVTEDGAQVVKIGDTYEVIGADGAVQKGTKDKVVITDDKGNTVTADQLADATKIKVAVTIDGKEYKGDHDVSKADGPAVAAPVTTVTTTAEPTTTKKPKTSTNDDDDDVDDADASTEASSGGGDDDSNSSTIIIVVVVVVVLLVIIAAAVVVVLKSKGAAPGDRSVVSFENPMYDQTGQPKQNPAAGGYAAPADPVSDGTYAEPFAGNNQGSSGYMDVQPGHQAQGQAASSGYMDVAPNHANAADSDDGEDV